MRIEGSRRGSLQGALTVAALAMSSSAIAEERPSVAPRNMQEMAPGLAAYTDGVLFGDIWERPELSPRDRSVVTLTTLIATGKSAQIASHLNRGLSNGVKPSEVSAIVTHLAFYTGWPNAVSAINVIAPVFAERKIDSSVLQGLKDAPSLPALDPATGADERRLAGVAPKFAELTDRVIFGDLWRRPDLSRRDRSLVTLIALAANGDTGQLPFHIRLGLENGLEKAQIIEAFTHLAFYAGLPKASDAIGIAERAFASGQVAASGETPPLTLFAPGQKPQTAPASNFTGTATLTSPFKGSGEARLGGATVTFQPGARTNWHVHPMGQLLVVTKGAGWVQAEGEPVRVIKAGYVVWTAPGVKHWHGAQPTGEMTHVAVSEVVAGRSVTWLEPVSDEQYRGPR
ncbi:(R)-mandelonitrile lyase [Sphingobium sp.]|uniref:(R)-mandelonitrile lyase n=1 Tax=Sphingobium sp. TaxID=1912891 RepID=UPI002B8D97D0|nr:carboxymuconolactone decarboxylase family protein [Sphingobium sp.]HUD94697.1 carboxymuconolactone decarboxylase family protein [Sphingobium sp.]